MSKRQEIYANYLKQFEGQIAPTVFHDASFCKNFQNADRYSGTTKISACSGRFEHTYKTDEGQIVEKYSEAQGLLNTFFVFRDAAHWNSYRAPMPWNVYWEN